jgi:hypothetical protein
MSRDQDTTILQMRMRRMLGDVTMDLQVNLPGPAFFLALVSSRTQELYPIAGRHPSSW